jgi:hypothetical protein
VSALDGNKQVSRYLVAYTNTTTKQGIVQLQFNAPNLPLFKKGTVAFIGDYIDIQGLDYVPDGVDAAGVTRWAWNTGATANSPAPMFMVTWADNRNVRRPGTAGWEQFTRINSAACEPGQAGIRNQDVYSAILKPGLSISAPLNARRIGDLQRSFPVVIANNTAELRRYRISVVPPAGVVASFDQFAGFGVGVPRTFLDLEIPPRSTATRTLFVLKSDDAAAEHVLVPVVVTETGGLGETDTVFLNPDLDNPDSADSTVDSQEAHLPLLADPTLQTFTNTAGGLKTPDFETPDFETPDFETPDFETPDFETPDFETPDFETPDFETPDFETPDFETPDFETAAVADVSWKVTNTGNVTSAYKPNINIQDGKIGTRYQLVVRTVTVQSLTNAANAASCTPGLMPQNQMLVNIVDPNVQSKLVGLNSSDFNDPDKKNATFTLGSHQSAVITLRAYCQKTQNGVPIPGVDQPGGCAADGPLPLTASGAPLVSASSVAQAANCQTCTGSGCDLLDFVGRGTVCTLDDGLPKDVYDPIPPKFGPAPAPTANDDNDPPGEEVVTFTLNVTDNVAVTSVSCDLGSVTPGSYSVTGTFPVGTTVVTCYATDVSGNRSADLIFNVVVNDVTPPTIEAHADVTAEATGATGAVVNYAYPKTADAVDGVGDASCALASGSTFPLGNTTVTCNATDAAGNVADPTTFVVRVVDTTSPSLTVPANITKYATGLSGAVVAYAAVGTDAVDASVTVVCTPPTGSTFPIGTTTVSCTATDDYKNATTRSFTVTIVKLEYVFFGVQNLPPPAGKTFKPGSAVPLKWQFKLDGVAVDSTAALPTITITGPAGIQIFTVADPGKSSFQPPTAANNWTWQFNWQTSAANGTNLLGGSYSISITSQQTGQTFSGGTIQLK